MKKSHTQHSVLAFFQNSYAKDSLKQSLNELLGPFNAWSFKNTAFTNLMLFLEETDNSQNPS